MIRKILAVSVLVSVIAGSATAEVRRTVFTRENRMPERYQLEVGASAFYREFPEEYTGDPNTKDEYTLAPYARYGALENVTVYGEVPLMLIDPKGGDSEQGLGDVVAGIELLAWEDIFGYPYFLPYAEVSFPTGDEDEGMGAGKALYTFGMSIGTTVQDVYHFVADAQYVIYREEENVANFSAAIIWDLSEQFSLQIEGRVADEQQTDPEGNHPLYILGGATYLATESLSLSVYGGGSQHADEDVIAGAKVGYSF